MKITFLIMIIALSLSSFSQTSPVTYYLLNINNTEYKIKEGEDLLIDSTLIKPTIKVKIAPYRSFNNPAISFDYPSHYSFQYDGEGSDMWTLTGNDFVIMYFDMRVEDGMDEFIETMVKQFGKKNTKIENTQLQLGDRNLKGKKLIVKLIGQTLELQILNLENNERKTRLLVLQDSLDDNSKPTRERIQTIKLMGESVTYN